MMPRGTPKRPIWGQKSALENKKDVQNEEKYELCEEIGKSNEKLQKPKPDKSENVWFRVDETRVFKKATCEKTKTNLTSK